MRFTEVGIFQTLSVQLTRNIFLFKRLLVQDRCISIARKPSVLFSWQYVIRNIGDSGNQSDGSVFANSFLGHAIENDMLNISKLSPLPNSETWLPFVFVGDDTFELKENMMKPYPSQNRILEEKVFDYRLSRTGKIIKNSFGIATARFRIFRRPVNAKVSTVKSETKAIVGLHNFFMKKNHAGDNQYCPPNYIGREGNDHVLPGDWRQEQNHISGLKDVRRNGSNNYSKTANVIRDKFKNYFVNECAVDWQWDIVNKAN